MIHTNRLKLVITAVLALALIVVAATVDDAESWAVPFLTLLIGYVIGNAQVSDRAGATTPIVRLDR